MSTNNTQHIKHFSYMRALACLAIILLHTAFTAIGLYGDTLPSGADLPYRTLCNLLMWAVPCFLMVTGTLVLNPNREITYKKLFTRYIPRILAAIVIFGFLFGVLDTFFGQESASLAVFGKQMLEIFTGQTWSQMWYLYCLIGIYLLLPFYRMITKQATDFDLKYLLIIYVIFLSLLPILNIWDVESGFYIHVSTIYPLYIFLGYYLWNHKGEKPGKTALLITLIVSTLLLILGSVLCYRYEITSLSTFFSYSSILVILQTASIFGLLALIPDGPSGLFGKLLLQIDRNSFGIYLIHMIFVRIIFKRIPLNPFTHGSWLCIIAVVIVVTFISWWVCWLLKKIPLFKKML